MKATDILLARAFTLSTLNHIPIVSWIVEMSGKVHDQKRWSEKTTTNSTSNRSNRRECKTMKNGALIYDYAYFSVDTYRISIGIVAAFVGGVSGAHSR